MILGDTKRECLHCRKMKPYDDFDYESDDDNHVNANCKGCKDKPLDKVFIEPVEKKVDYTDNRCPRCDIRGINRCDCYKEEPDGRSTW